MIIQDLVKKELLHPPKWLPDNIIYLIWGGSTLYGMQTDDSDMDAVGICVPPKGDVFPRSEIIGFGTHKKRFEQYIQHHVNDKNALGGKGRIYDFTIFSIIKYFHLALQNNPNTLEILFCPQSCIIHCDQVGQMIRENRKMFLHKGSKHRYVGYSFSQKNKMKSQTRTGKRKEVVDRYGYDLKFAAHALRLLDQGIQILAEGDLDPQREREKLKSIRRGEWTLEQLDDYFQIKEKEIEDLYEKSKLPYGPDEPRIKQLLLDCLEQHYGSLSDVDIVIEGKEESILKEIKKLVENY